VNTQLRKSSLTPSQSLRNIPRHSIAASCRVRFRWHTACAAGETVIRCGANLRNLTSLARITRVRIPDRFRAPQSWTLSAPAPRRPDHYLARAAVRLFQIVVRDNHLFCIAASAAATTSSAAKIPNDQLDSLVAPLALYPDPLLAQVLAASTYPLEIIHLEQWLTKHPDLKG
jgi:hypothetical protein